MDRYNIVTRRQERKFMVTQVKMIKYNGILPIK